METQLMIRTAIVLLALTGVGGLTMAVIRFSGRPHPPSIIAMLHGLIASSGLTLLFYAAATHGLPAAAWMGLAVLVVAALGGLVLNLGYHWKNLPLPYALVLVHAAAAAFGLVVLAIGGWNVTAA